MKSSDPVLRGCIFFMVKKENRGGNQLTHAVKLCEFELLSVIEFV